LPFQVEQLIICYQATVQGIKRLAHCHRLSQKGQSRSHYRRTAHHIKTLGIFQKPQEASFFQNTFDIQPDIQKQFIPKWNPDVFLQKSQITLDSQVF